MIIIYVLKACDNRYSDIPSNFKIKSTINLRSCFHRLLLQRSHKSASKPLLFIEPSFATVFVGAFEGPLLGSEDPFEDPFGGPAPFCGVDAL